MSNHDKKSSGSVVAGDSDGVAMNVGGDAADNVTLTGSDGADTLVGGDGDDTLDGGAGDDRLDGGGGDDQLIGGGGNDNLNGGDGNDTLRGGNGNDVTDGGDGVDTVDFSDIGVGITADLADGVATYSPAPDVLITDDLIDIENIIGSANDDNLQGDDGDNVIVGGGGNDVLVGGGGDDTLRGGNGNDVTDGGDGVDTVDFSDIGVGVDVNLADGVATYSPAPDVLITDQLIDLENVIGSANDDNLQGDDGDNVIVGGGGNDVLVGGGGDDTLVAGDGADAFIFNMGSGQDQITGYDAGQDRMDVSDYGFADSNAVLARAQQDGDDVVIDLDTDSGDQITLVGVSLDDLQQQDFMT